MRFFSSNDSIASMIFQVITAAGIGFGIYAYFHSIQPVFEQQLELESLRSEKATLKVAVESLRVVAREYATSVGDLTSYGDSLTDQIREFKDRFNELSSRYRQASEEVQSKDSLMTNLLKSESGAGDEAVQRILELWCENLKNQYWSATVKVRGQDQFRLLEATRQLVKGLEHETASSSSPYDDIALEFLKSRLLPTLESTKIPDSQIMAVYMIPVRYKYRSLEPASK